MGLPVKLAVIVLFASIVAVIGLSLPEASPVQPVNVKPELGVAVSVTRAPAAYAIWFGLKEMVPPLPGLAFAPNV